MGLAVYNRCVRNLSNRIHLKYKSNMNASKLPNGLPHEGLDLLVDVVRINLLSIAIYNSLSYIVCLLAMCFQMTFSLNFMSF